ncbi:MAG: methyl-accepting chemotaxis protein [Oscillospiraceae bacterium]
MKKNLTKRILAACIAALIFMITVLFIVQTGVMKSNAKVTGENRIADIVGKLAANEIATAELTEELNSDYIAKADAFAEMIRLDPSILDDAKRLDEIAAMLDVDELHVTDENGIIYWGTVPEYFGFDFDSSDQTREFLPILKDSSLKIAQEPQPNGASGKLFQYISVARKDSTGIVQVGNTPERLQSQIENNNIDNVLDSFAVGSTGYVIAISKSDGLIAAHPDKELIGTSAADAGVSEKLLGGADGVFCKINGENLYCVTGENDGYILIAAMPKSEVYGGRTMLMLIFVVSIAVMLVIVIMLINNLIQKVIINGINQVLKQLDVVSSGDLDVSFDVRTCPEYISLSDGLNSMLANIRDNMDETVRRNQEQQRVFEQVTEISADIGSESNEMQEVSTQLSDGSATQAATIEELSASFDTISQQINDNARAAADAGKIAAENARTLDAGAEKLGEMQGAMRKIQESSDKIGNIVKTIEDIAFQTNILALNAAVEAARAGQHGKGFAVVADEVRNLATKSAEATKGTAVLIDETLKAVAEGSRIADETAEQLRLMMSGVSESNKLIDSIAAASEEQAASFEQISESMTHISAVVQQNAHISANAASTASKLDGLARSLGAVFE